MATATPRTYTFLTKCFMALCSLILTLHSVEVLQFRFSTKTTSHIAQQETLPYHMHPDLIHYDISRMRNSAYLGAHVAPVLLWCILTFIQTSKHIRAHYIYIHRFSGRLMLLTSFYMIAAVFAMLWNENVYGTQQVSLRSTTTTFTFRTGAAVFGVYWVLCLVQLYRYAKRSSVWWHRFWTWQFMAAGYGVATFRILFGVAASVMYPAFGDRVIDKEVQNVLMGYLLWVAYILNIGVVSWRYWVEFGTGAKTA